MSAETIKIIILQSGNALTGAQPEIFQGREGFVKFGYFNKHFLKYSRKKGPAGKISEFFLLDTLKTTF